MPALRLLRPLWLDRPAAGRAPAYPRLRRRIAADVAVIGGGCTGAAAAWRFASAGLRTVVVEAERIGRGSTAASTALLMQEPDEDLLQLRRRYGQRAAARIWALGRQATREFVSTLRELDISCDLEERDSVYYTLDERYAPRLKREHESRRRAGFRAAWLDAAALRASTGIRGVAGIRARGNAQADPYKACIGLVAEARRHGAEIFERSPVRRVQTTAEGVVVVTSAGAVEAPYVVVATGYARPRFAAPRVRMRLKNTYVAATRRLTMRERADVGLSDVMIWETGRPYHYARWTSDRRLLMGGGDIPKVTGARRRRALDEGIAGLREYFEQLFPALQSIPFEYRWEGMFATTPDSLPYIGPHRRYPRHLFALGYGGNGMTLGFLASKLLLDYIQGAPSPDLDLFAFGRFRS
jgi:glycine/D-amino acid oxidase-like deaminating enzyme